MSYITPSQKMVRYLNSLGVEDVSRFDMDFLSIKHDIENREKIVFTFKKSSSWKEDLLHEFLLALSNANYPFDVRFEYERTIEFEDVDALFQNWYMHNYMNLPPFQLMPGEEKTIYASFPDSITKKEVNAILKEFSSLISFINYPFHIELEQSVNEASSPKEETEKKLAKPHSTEENASLKSKQNNVEEIEPEGEEAESNDDPEYSDEEAEKETRRLQLQEAEQAYLQSLEHQKWEQSRREIYKKGNYVKLERIADAFEKKTGNVEVVGEVVAVTTKTTRKGKLFSTFTIGKVGDGGLKVRAFASKSGIPEERLTLLGDGQYVDIRGSLERDERTGELGLFAHYMDDALPPPLREDPEERKRVELHLHTKMSAMDGLGDINDYIKLAMNMGMKALAITDHGNLQCFPIAESALKKIKSKKPDADFRIIYGVEFYTFRKPQYVYNPINIPLKRAKYCVFDFETTGLSYRYDHPTEFGGVIVENGMVTDRLDLFIDAGVPIPEKIQKKTHITNDMLKGAPNEVEAVKRISEFIGSDDVIMVSHNARFDIGFLNAMRKKAGMPPLPNPVIDTLALSYYLFPEAARHNLGALSRNLKLDVYNNEEAHRADFDAEALNSVWQAIIPILERDTKNPSLTHKDLMSLEITNRNVYKHMKTFHTIALAQNQEGLKTLYKLVSKSETVYMAAGSTPKIDVEDLAQNHQNILYGSACFNGEVFSDASERSQEELEKAMELYDYIEVQPKENYSYLVDTEELSEDRLLSILRSIIDTGDKLHKRVVATGDCHYVNPEDKILRDLYINAKALGGGLHPLHYIHREELKNPDFESPDQHFRSTKEMLDSFRSWLPEEVCQRIVVDASNEIADLCNGDIKILKSKLYTPDANLPGSAEKLREICYGNLKNTYGDNPDPKIKDRLDKELAGIINNGYSVTYYIAHLLIKWANSKGFFVGSRGSVGSSFAANMAGITEVNPLPPHYLCPKCKRLEWAEDPSLRSGFDLAKKKCPHCGEEMLRNGQSIPFETFLGFHAEKVPDIDLNFPQDRLGLAHDETRLLLSTKEENEAYAKGEPVESPHVIRAGTIAKAESKNCFGYVKKYYEDVLGKAVGPDDQAYVSYLSEKATGVKRTTGQHPGGIVVIPADMEIFDFTPYQYPADDPTAGWLTTHFDFASMHDSVLKLDELGHVDPMALRIMHELTGIDFRSIPMNDPKVLSLFTSPKALGLKENRLGFKTGAIALPEFGTNFVQGLLEEAKPRTFNDLLIISGLSHGTNVWNGNAEDLVLSGKSLEQVIGCRDDIMNYLIQMGVDSGTAFKIMEYVRKNKVGNPLKPEFEEAMRKAKVPEWYIDSCRKIRYLFPRAHATAYVMAALRVAWYKVYCPLEFYATYFFTRCHSFDIKIMSGGIDSIMAGIQDIQERSARKETNDTDDEKLKSYMAALEMVERGYTLENINLMESDSSMWKVSKERNSVIPPFTCIPNFSQRAAEGIVEARKEGAFLSKENLLSRVKKAKDASGQPYAIGNSIIEALDDVGALKGLGESDQMSLFEFNF